MYYEVYITYFSRNSPSEGTAEARSDMNSTRQSRPPRMLKRLQGAYLQRYMRERMDLRDRRILSTGAQSDNTENLVQKKIKKIARGGVPRWLAVPLLRTGAGPAHPHPD